ncbi:hypothetical protein MHU86_24659 [Fragilaria crotonensis]|nr:hypothetical protein MHU86_24659 [Fragilaria crotonensis]
MPQAAWSAVQFALAEANAASLEFWSPSSITALVEEATAQAKASSKTESALQLFLSVVAQAPIPEELKTGTVSKGEFSVFSIFWDKLCKDLGERLQGLLKTAKLSSDVAALYPAVRSSILGMLGRLYDHMQTGMSSSSISLDETASSTCGILGGSAALDSTTWSSLTLKQGEAPSGLGAASADSWTRADVVAEEANDHQAFMATSAGTTTSLSAIFASAEWKSMQSIGFQPLQTAFLESCRQRLCTPIQFMFPEGLSVDDDGVAMQVLPTLPSRYDMQKLDHSIRAELSLADPREGGGELSMTTMIAEVIVGMVELFCARAKTAVIEAGEEGCLTDDGLQTDSFVHDLKVANIMSTLATALKNAPENTFVVPYRPATSAQHEEAAILCQQALVPALAEIEKMVKNLILTPLSNALNRRVAAAIAKMHHGTYLESMSEDNDGPSFVQKHLSGLFESIAEQHLAKLPTEYAGIVASTVASFSIYTFVSNASLIRPLGETARLHITQDLADFELALEQLVLKGGSSMALSQIEMGKPYAELRAVRQMFYWTGLEDRSLGAASVAKSMLREVWVRMFDLRLCFIFSSALPLTSSPRRTIRNACAPKTMCRRSSCSTEALMKARPVLGWRLWLAATPISSASQWLEWRETDVWLPFL